MKNIRDKSNKSVKGDKRRLSSAADVRLFLSGLIRNVEADRITESKGKTLTYMASVLLRVIEGGDLEKRIEALEKQTNGGKP
jgi:hypothetical protein